MDLYSETAATKTIYTGNSTKSSVKCQNSADGKYGDFFFLFFFPAIKNVISDVAPLRCLQKSWVIISTTWSYWASSVGDQKRSSFLAMDKTAGQHSSAFMSRVVVGVVERHSKVIYWASSSSSCQNQSSVYVCVIFKSISAALADKMSLCVVMWLDF